MNEQRENDKSSSTILKTDGGKTETNAIEIPSIGLPKGGGAIKGIDEKFSVNAVNGTSSFSIPLPFSPARGISANLNLSYNSGAGNGVFGLGWNLNLPSIKRKTDKQLPQYIDTADSDIYLFSDAEDLVPVFKKEANGSFKKDANNNYIIHQEDSPDALFSIRFYQPRIEGLFARIEKWTHKTSGEIKWRVISKENVTTLFGWNCESRIADPKDNKRIFEWLPEIVFDDKGNCVRYIYKKEDAKGFDNSLLHNRNRFEKGNITYTNLYLEKVLYGNKTPYKIFGQEFPSEMDFIFQTVFDYGEYEQDQPFQKIKDWDFRTDAFSDNKAGFEIRTSRLCRRVLLFHFFEELPGSSALVRSLDFEYNPNIEEGFTFLKSITEFGYVKKTDGTYTHKSLPANEFEYQKHDWNKTIKSISSENLVHSPSGLGEPQYQFTDLFNEGLSGILTEQANGWYYKHNLGGGKFEQAKLVSPKPSFAGLGNGLQLTDLDSDGTKQLVSYKNGQKGFFELNDDEQWQAFRSFESLPNINLADANTRMLDINGDGKADALITEDNVFTCYESAGRKGFTSKSHQTQKPFDEEKGPNIIFADPLQTIFLADMTGDGMTDIVRVRNGEVCYWANLGYGKFGAKVAMDFAPVFDYPDSFNPAYLRFADIDGSGTTDIIYLGKNKFTCWMNLSGNAFSKTPFEIDTFPEIYNQSKITVTDLLGNGVACLVWSSNLAKDTNSPLKYIDLMSSKKPHLLVAHKNNLGKEVSLEYKPSTKFYIEDKLAGKPWKTKLHFPVQCISKTETRDTISGFRFTSFYKYHHGYFDHAEREFRGFGMVEQIDSEHFEHWIKGDAANIVDQPLHQEPVVTKSWFHTGAFLNDREILSQFADEYWFEEMKRQGFSVINNEVELSDARLILSSELDPSEIDSLSPQEWREVLRACKGINLRSEVFAKDAPLTGATAEDLKKELTPFTVSAKNCVVELLQPKGQNKHAIFVVKESENITYDYERNSEDPRIAHSLNIKLDKYGNVLESASVVYPRLLSDPALPAETQDAQNETIISYVENNFTNDINSADAYRLPLPSEIKTFELKGISKANTFYGPDDFDNILETSVTADYHETDKNPIPGFSQKRLIEQIRTIFYKDDLSGELPLGQMESKAIPFESYQIAYTLPLVTHIFGAKVNTDLMLEGKFTHSIDELGLEDDNWWIRSGTTQFIEASETFADAENRFFVPVSYTDPFGAKTKVKYHSNYFLFIEETEDALRNKTKVLSFNMRTLSPQRMQDFNGNISEVITDELGLVKALAVFGKGNEADDLSGINEFTSANEKILIDNFFNAPASNNLIAAGKDLLQHSTTRFVYDLDAYKNSDGKKPVAVASIVREEHFQTNNDSPIQFSFEYSNGLGQVILQKAQAEPGLAKEVVVNSDETYTVTEIDTSALNPAQLRWIGNGRTVLNNKGNPVKQYEPYFSVTHRFEDFQELVETGVTPILYYDALSRLVKTEMPDSTFSKTVFDSWKQTVYDQNDTILESAWYQNRTKRLIDTELISEGKDPGKEKIAADKAAKHANTPATQHFDPLGRPVLSVEHNKNILTEADEFYQTKVKLDTEGNLLRVIDAHQLPENGNQGNRVMEYKYDMLGNLVYQNNMDSGRSWLLINILDEPLRTWDERNHEFQYFYDELHRPIQSKVIGGDGSAPLDNVFHRNIYGESLLLPDDSNRADLQADNILGEIIQHFDTGGVLLTPKFDFKGQAKFTTRKLFQDYRSVANWTDANLESDLETEEFTSANETDALGRITRQTAPDGSIITPSYNETGLLNGETVEHLAPAETNVYIKDIDYNEKGQRKKIVYGNDVTTKFFYDRETFRLKHLETKRHNSDPLQDFYYTFDAVGNITHIEDKNIPVVFFDNQKVTGVSEFTYDALYRLAEATGREHNAALPLNSKDNWNDKPFSNQLNPNDPIALRNYTQSYQYDEVGNILEMHHEAAGNIWTRGFEYEKTNNRLKKTQVGTQTYAYTHHPQNGFITDMPHLQEMSWSFKEELVKTIRQKVNPENGTPETTYYQYDGQGQRIRKITENSAISGAVPSKKEERIYISGYELYKQHSGANSGLERVSLGLIDGGHRFVLIETRNDFDDGTEKRLIRYQIHSDLGSVNLELDNSAEVISYEEYHPFGTTAYQAKNKAIKSAAKRYRYTAMERDEETGLEYHSARYYLPWLGRWLSADPIGIGDGVNLYSYVQNNPIIRIDPEGQQYTVFERQLDKELSTPEGSERVFRRSKAFGDFVFPRIGGLLKMVGGGLEVTAGAAGAVAPEPVTTALGTVAIAHGTDTFWAGWREFWNGKPTETLTSQGLQALGVSKSNANMADALFGIATSGGTSVLVKGPKVVTVVDDVPSVSLAFKPNTGNVTVAGKEVTVGHNMVGINTGAGTQWSHLVRNKAGEAFVRSAPKVKEGYKVATVPVKAAKAKAAAANAAKQVKQGSAGAYTVCKTDCATYASSVLKSGGVRIPWLTSPSVNYAATALRTPKVVQASRAAGAGAATIHTANAIAIEPSSNPSDYSSFDDYAAAQAGPLSNETLMNRWAATHGWVSQQQ